MLDNVSVYVNVCALLKYVRIHVFDICIAFTDGLKEYSLLVLFSSSIARFCYRKSSEGSYSGYNTAHQKRKRDRNCSIKQMRKSIASHLVTVYFTAYFTYRAI